METQEIIDLLNKMGALGAEEDAPRIASRALMQDPIVTNRLAVELLQKLDRDLKPEAVLAPAGEASYFGYSVALAAWMRFLYATADEGGFTLPEGTNLNKKERVLIVLDGYDEDVAAGLVAAVRDAGAKPLAVLSLSAPTAETAHGCPTLSLID